jgi:uncharacterized sporulation protein YeaH/YhbH (DUF444 family)
MGIVYDRKPSDVMVSVGFVNDDLRTGRLLFPLEDTESQTIAEMAVALAPEEHKQRVGQLFQDLDSPSLAREAGRVMKSVNQRTKKIEINKRGYHSDLTEALRYAHHVARAYRAKAPPPPKTDEQRRYDHEDAKERAGQSGEW